MNTDIEHLLREQIPKLKSKVQEILQKSGKGIDAYGPEKLFEQVHELLPFPVRALIKKDRFVAFCVKNKSHFLE